MLEAKPRTPQRSPHNEARKDTYKTICTSCGGAAVVPFVPIAGKDIYCSDCFNLRKQNGLLSKRILKEEEERKEREKPMRILPQGMKGWKELIFGKPDKKKKSKRIMKFDVLKL